MAQLFAMEEIYFSIQLCFISSAIFYSHKYLCSHIFWVSLFMFQITALITVVQTYCKQQIKGGDFLPLVCSCETPSDVLHPALKSLAQEDMEPLEGVKMRVRGLEHSTVKKI